MTYEEAYRRLEEITALLENPGLELAESVRLYEEGKKLLKFCESALTEAEQKITVLDENPKEDSHEL